MPWLDLSYKKYTLKKLDLLMKCNVGIFFYWFTVCCGFYCLSNKFWPIIGSHINRVNGTVCPGSSDPPEKKYSNIFASEN